MTLKKIEIINNIFIFISLILYFFKNFYLYKFIKKDGNKFGKFLLNVCNLCFILINIPVILYYIGSLYYIGNFYLADDVSYYAFCGLVEINIAFLTIILSNIKRNKIFKFMFLITILELIFPVFSYIVFYVLNYTIYYNSY